MPYGTHSYYAMPRISCLVDNKEDYLLGRFTGDFWHDPAHGQKIKTLNERLAKIWGWGGFQLYWESGILKPYKPLDDLQKYKRAVTKIYNLHKKKINAIIQANTLFVDDYIAEETSKLHARIQVLKERYKQTT